jgi:hypothetical protein
MAKKLTLIILSLAFIVGCVGAWFMTFNMEGFISFLKGFAPLYISLIASIGANSAMEKYKGKEE